MYPSKLADGGPIILHSNRSRTAVGGNSEIWLFREYQISSRELISALFPHDAAEDNIPPKRDWG